MKSAGKSVSARVRSARAASAPSAARPAKTPPRRARSASGWSAFDGRTILLGVVGILIFATLITAVGPSSDEPKVATIDDTPLTADVELSPAPESVPPARRATAPAPPQAPVLRTASLSYAPSVAPHVEAPPVPAAAVTRVSTVEPVAEPRQSEPESTATVATAVTISGCLARDDERFVLKNVSGDGAPTSRSWKSGFLRKRSSSIELIDPARSNRLASYVGRQIETSGVLEDREMHVKSLRVQGTCD